jgi:hypothetical protein
VCACVGDIYLLRTKHAERLMSPHEPCRAPSAPLHLANTLSLASRHSPPLISLVLYAPKEKARLRSMLYAAPLHAATARARPGTGSRTYAMAALFSSWKGMPRLHSM